MNVQFALRDPRRLFRQEPVTHSESIPPIELQGADMRDDVGSALDLMHRVGHLSLTTVHRKRGYENCRRVSRMKQVIGRKHVDHRVLGPEPYRSIGIFKERILIGVDGGQAVDTIYLQPLSFSRLFEVGNVDSVWSASPQPAAPVET